MGNCKHMLQHNEGFGKWKSQCVRAEWKDGYCKKHYEKRLAKAMLYGDRTGYREATTDDLINNGPMLYLKIRGSYGGHKYKNGVIINGGSYKDTKILADPALFVVKTKFYG